MKTPYSVCRILLVIVLAAAFVALPLPVKADGGPIVGPHLWAFLKEGRQIAVITLWDTERAEVDLFISMLDSTGESHEVVFFVPLGSDPASFSVREKDSMAFDRSETEKWDNILHEDARRKHMAINSLFAATLLTNGIWLLPLWAPVVLSGCAEAAPEATFETDSSQVSIYGLDENTDLEGLISTTGLDPSVRDTLLRLRGQKIAVVNLQTQARGTGDGSGEGPAGSEPGIHLNWTTLLIPGDSGATYAYPLGTGDAWFHPIEITRVYVAAAQGVDFSVQYPRLGRNASGYIGTRQQRITTYQDVPAYAIDEAYTESWHVWRATYTQSNSAEDIVITAKPQSNMSRIFAGMRSAGTDMVSLIFGIITALVFWLLGWRYLMPRLLGISFREENTRLWRIALAYVGINLLLMIPGAFIYMIWSFTGMNLMLAVLFILFGGVSVIIYTGSRLRKLGDSRGRAIKAFALVTLASNGAYLVVALIFTALTGII